MNDDTEFVNPSPLPGTDAHEAWLRFEAARRIARKADAYRRLGIDPSKAASDLVDAGLSFLVDGR